MTRGGRPGVARGHSLGSDDKLADAGMGRARNEEKNGCRDADQNRVLHADEDGRESCDEHENCVEPRGADGISQPFPVDQARGGNEEQTGQHGGRNKARVRPKENDDDGHDDAGINARSAGDRARLEVDGRPRQRSRARQRLKEAAHDIADAFGDDLAIIIQRLPGVGGDRLRHRECFQQIRGGKPPGHP